MSPENAEAAWKHGEVVVEDGGGSGVRLHYVEAGSGPLIVLLHGFPEYWYSWRHQIPALAAAGFRVVAPDMRGYNLSDKPRGVRSYRMGALVADVRGLIAALGESRAIVVGHDWGGVIAWFVAMQCPEMVDKLVILNAPHPASFARGWRNLRQLRKSWYIAAFQLPRLPEARIRAGNYRIIRQLFSSVVRRDGKRPRRAFSREEIEGYVNALGQPNALTSTLNYYRALIRYGRDASRVTRRVTSPALLIWGEHDPYLGVELTEGLEPWAESLRVARLPDAGHWMQNEQPSHVNHLIVEFIIGPGNPPDRTVS